MKKMKKRFLNAGARVPFKAVLKAVLFLLLVAVPVALRAQTATIFGSLNNFDVVNNCGNEAHGFEIELEGLQPADAYYSFSAERYGAPQIIPYATGIHVRWASPYDSAAQQFAQTTVPHDPGTPFVGSCYMWGLNYNASGCEHFGVSLRASCGSPK